MVGPFWSAVAGAAAAAAQAPAQARAQARPQARARRRRRPPPFRARLAVRLARGARRAVGGRLPVRRRSAQPGREVHVALHRLLPCGGAQASRSTNARGPGAVRSRHTATEPNQYVCAMPLQQQELESLQRCASRTTGPAALIASVTPRRRRRSHP